MIVDLTLPLLLDVVADARPNDAREITAMRWDDDCEAWAAEIMAQEEGCIRYAALDRDGRPGYAWGYRAMWPGTWATWGVGTSRWPHVWREVTKTMRKVIIPTFRKMEAERVVCFVLADKLDAIRWFAHVETTEAADLPAWGKHGEHFKLFEWRP